MRIDVVSIFPDYFAPLELSLLGKARESGLVTLATHDLRTGATDRHRTVDDTPYGGGAGMVLKPEPWGVVLDKVLPPDPSDSRLVVPTPAGEPFTQSVAERLAAVGHLVFACGRYEGIDQRVIDHYRSRVQVEEISIGDFILGGGEVAAMVIVEAVVRLLPGFLGNPASLAEESHQTGEAGGMLEYPVYTKPPSWRSLDVPDVLLSGHHGNIAAWRRDQAMRRTAARRPDLLHGSQLLQANDESLTVMRAVPADDAELLVLQRCCWVAEAQSNDTLDIPALLENLDDVRSDIDRWDTYVVRAAGRLVASVRGRLEGEVWAIGRLMVAPDLEGRGLGRRLLTFIEAAAPETATSYELFTGAGSADNLRMYRKAGYRIQARDKLEPGVVTLAKQRR